MCSKSGTSSLWQYGHVWRTSPTWSPNLCIAGLQAPPQITATPSTEDFFYIQCFTVDQIVILIGRNPTFCCINSILWPHILIRYPTLSWHIDSWQQKTHLFWMIVSSQVNLNSWLGYRFHSVSWNFISPSLVTRTSLSPCYFFIISPVCLVTIYYIMYNYNIM